MQFMTAYMLGSKYFRFLRDTGIAVTECDNTLISGANVEYLKAQVAYWTLKQAPSDESPRGIFVLMFGLFVRSASRGFVRTWLVPNLLL
jgi:hypothetical protein